MEKIIVRGGNKLQGTVRVEGAKNAVLPVIAASLIASEGKRLAAITGSTAFFAPSTLTVPKNAVLPVIAASLIASEGKSVIRDVPFLADVSTINEVLRNMNAEVNFTNNEITVDASKQLKTEAPFEYVRKMRASVLVLGPLLARFGHAKVALPGGCAIGSRPIDLHLKVFEAMGATVHVGNGFVEVTAPGRLKGAKRSE